MTEHQDFVEDYEFFRSFAMSDSRIARLMGISEQALAKRRERAGIRGGDSPVHARLTLLIESRREFDSLDFPMTFAPQDVASVLAVAKRQGLIVRVRTRPDPFHGHRIGVFRAAV
ncbi:MULTISPECIES: hypothetical protein [unclassified Nocardia]|uniref:hypothetical protein n=1 Tax=unclassified Nocardia TaxID=2637762 RepID=UPI001CE40F0A|nr:MULTISPECIES: hypothetical protein [unclassified Nocardia]